MHCPIMNDLCVRYGYIAVTTAAESASIDRMDRGSGYSVGGGVGPSNFVIDIALIDSVLVPQAAWGGCTVSEIFQPRRQKFF